MNKTTHGNASRVRVLNRWTHVRDEMNERRHARAHYRELERELASYSTRADVDDLLSTIEGQQGAEADMIRTILTNNLMRRPTRHLLAS